MSLGDFPTACTVGSCRRTTFFLFSTYLSRTLPLDTSALDTEKPWPRYVTKTHSHCDSPRPHATHDTRHAHTTDTSGGYLFRLPVAKPPILFSPPLSVSCHGVDGQYGAQREDGWIPEAGVYSPQRRNRRRSCICMWYRLGHYVPKYSDGIFLGHYVPNVATVITVFSTKHIRMMGRCHGVIPG